MEILRRHGARRVLDVATGTGFHSCRLSVAGFEVVSVDGSPAMLAKAQANAARRGLTLTPVLADWRNLAEKVQGPFDAVICLGNSFTHLFTDAERRQALEQYHRLLGPGRVLIMDQRNYDLILDRGYHTKHVYYYCDQGVRVEPEHMDEGLARFCYTFPDRSKYYLNMCPLRLKYLLGLLTRAASARWRPTGTSPGTRSGPGGVFGARGHQAQRGLALGQGKPDAFRGHPVSNQR